MTDPKKKGNSNENALAKQLSLWITKGERKDVLMRSKTSGAIGTTQGAGFSNQAGDIVAADAQGFVFVRYFLIEAKHYKTINIELLTFSKDISKTKLYVWWTKLRDECKTHSKRPFLIAKQNRRNTLLFLTKEDVSIFQATNLVKSKFKMDNEWVSCILFDDFLENVPSEYLRKYETINLQSMSLFNLNIKGS